MDMFLDFADRGVIDLVLFWGSDAEHQVNPYLPLWEYICIR